MLKQMLENNLPVKIVSWDTENLYRCALILCKIGDYSLLNSYLINLDDFKEVYKNF